MKIRYFIIKRWQGYTGCIIELALTCHGLTLLETQENIEQLIKTRLREHPQRHCIPLYDRRCICRAVVYTLLLIIQWTCAPKGLHVNTRYWRQD